MATSPPSDSLPPGGQDTDGQKTPETKDRRDFMAKSVAVVIGGFTAVVPFAAGLTVFFDPLWRTGSGSTFIKVATKDSVPDDGIPRQFPVIANRTDAWNYYPDEPIGLVYLRREKGSDKIEALQAICPHAGCIVDFNIPNGQFQCPCHNSNFEPDGVRIDPEACPSPRDLDILLVDPERLGQAEGEIWVEFKKFRAATSEKIAEQ